ncbi:MAG TPA: hypothetical protein PKJ16_02900, partial [Spirochaetota bacterium]|nr:hypothetical protein [Spirochaetota bacterium]
MKKKTDESGAYYTIMWSKMYKYDKYEAQRILPELTGILCLLEKKDSRDPRPILFYNCWREGLKIAIKNL